MISLPVQPIDLERMQPIFETNKFTILPNMCYNIYKCRRGKYNHIKLWLYFDAGNCRTTELFATTNDYIPLEIKPINIINNMKVEEEGKDIEEALKKTEIEIETPIKPEEYSIDEDIDDGIKFVKENLPW